jgi:hypothetical protein
MNERGLILRIVQRRRQQDDVKLALWQLFPRLGEELTVGKPGLSPVNGDLGLVNPDHLGRAIKAGIATKKTFIAADIEKTLALQRRQA